LNAAITAANARVQANYTEATWETFVTARSAAIAVRDNADATQSQVDAALASLNTAANALVEDTSTSSGGCGSGAIVATLFATLALGGVVFFFKKDANQK
ncbi:MAG: hypothetical protein FWC80_04745, partial [Firmicutes bacterium]|nr:hypothetical protein [Bacillota bacterium]